MCNIYLQDELLNEDIYLKDYPILKSGIIHKYSIKEDENEKRIKDENERKNGKA